MAETELIKEQDLYNLVRSITSLDWTNVQKEDIKSLAHGLQWNFSDNDSSIDCTNQQDQIVLLGSFDGQLVDWVSLFICWWDKNGEYDDIPGYFTQDDRVGFDQLFQDIIYLLNASAGQPILKDDNYRQDFSRVAWGFENSIMQLYQAQQDEFSGVEMCISFRTWWDKTTTPDPW